jgi:hypothetical protein
VRESADVLVSEKYIACAECLPCYCATIFPLFFLIRNGCKIERCVTWKIETAQWNKPGKRTELFLHSLCVVIGSLLGGGCWICNLKESAFSSRLRGNILVEDIRVFLQFLQTVWFIYGRINPFPSICVPGKTTSSFSGNIFKSKNKENDQSNTQHLFVYHSYMIRLPQRSYHQAVHRKCKKESSCIKVCGRDLEFANVVTYIDMCFCM